MKKGRREFLRLSSAASLGFLTPGHLASGEKTNRLKKDNVLGDICVFSKHLQFLDYEEMADTAAKIGFDGVDLTVRSGGHILPEKVKKDLPRAIKAIRSAGLSAPMMATDINDPEDQLTEPVLETAAEWGIRHYRMAYLPYDFEAGIIPSLDRHQKTMHKLAILHEKYGIVGNYQNHDGIHVGAPIWDLYRLLEKENPNWIGCQFDIRHATVEGGHSWPVDFHLMAPYVQSLVIKDFKWGMVNGNWEIINTPIGEGMVDFRRFFELVSKLGVGGPITMHFEYPMTDPLSGKSEKEQVVEKMKTDLDTLLSLLKDADLK